MDKRIKKYIILFFVAVCFVKTFMFDFYFIDGDSMNPTLCDKEVVLVKKTKEFERFDIIICEVESNGIKGKIVKRVIGLPNEKVQIKDGFVYINGTKINDVISEKIECSGIAEDELLLKDGECFVLGDNRNQSKDSRHEWIGIIKKEQIVGRVILNEITVQVGERYE